MQKYSFRITDRVQLFNLINEFKNVPQEEIINENSTTTKPIPENIEVKTETLQEENKKEVQLEFEIESNDTTILTPEESNRGSKTETDNVDESILQHAFSANYQLPDLNIEELSALEEKNISTEKVVEEIIKEEPAEIEIDTAQSFNSWLTTNKNYKESEHLDKLEITAIANHTDVTKEESPLFGETKKPKKEFFSPTAKAKESLQEDSLPVSETLAKIYALQGNFPKAISAYKQLSLKYPEKKIFFAIRIKELEKKINN